jgi:hypothetical protein
VVVVALRRRVPVRPVLAGAAPVVALLLAYDRAVTGSALGLPFTLLEPSDTPGFGLRRIIPELPFVRFDPLDGLWAMGAHLLALGGWLLLGPVLAAGAVVSVRRRDPGSALLAATVALSVAGYTCTWGPWNASSQWGGDRLFGPFYLLPVAAALAIMGAPTALRWARSPAGAAALALVAAANVVVLGVVVAENLEVRRLADGVLALADEVPDGDVLVVDTGFPYLSHAVPALGLSDDLLRRDPDVRAATGSALRSAAGDGRDAWRLGISFLYLVDGGPPPVLERLQPGGDHRADAGAVSAGDRPASR